ncbi:MAG: CsbD family protein [Aggregatilineales bacterium]
MAVQSNGVWDQLAGSWKQMQGQVRKQWGKLTDDDLAQIRGQRDILAGKLQQHYGIAKEEANRQIDDWANKLKF